jgi:hypothetical protein
VGKHTKACREFVDRYLGRAWTDADGLAEKEIKKAEACLGVKLPSSLRDFYLTVGGVADLCSIHNVIFSPKDLVFEDGYLLFMDENQSVVTWGIKRKDLGKADPDTWQHNNSSEVWYPEKKTVLGLLISMFDWYKELGVWKPRNRARR